MSREKDLIKNTAIISFGKMCTQLVSFFLLPLYTSILSTAEYGIVDLVITYSSLLFPFVTLSLEQAVFRFLIDARDNEQTRQEIISTSFVFILMQCFFVVVIIGITQTFLHSSLIWFFSIIVVTTVWSATALQTSRGLGDTLGYTLGSTFSAIVQVSCNVLFLVIFHWGAPGMMMATACGNLACAGIIIFRLKVFKEVKLKYIKKSILMEQLKYSLPLIPNQLSWWALNASDKIIVQFFIGITGNGLIAVANKFSSMYIQFSNIFNISWTESATLHINDKDAELFFSRTINEVYCVFLCACCVIIDILPFAFKWLVNPQYNESYGLIPVFMLSALFNVVVSLYGVIYVAYKKTVEIAKTAIYAALINIILHLMLINYIGIYAAAVSTMAGYGCMAVYRYFHSRKYMTIKFTYKTTILSIIMIIASFFSYYSKCVALEVIVFLIVAGLSLWCNKAMLSSIWELCVKKIKG